MLRFAHYRRRCIAAKKRGDPTGIHATGRIATLAGPRRSVNEMVALSFRSRTLRSNISRRGLKSYGRSPQQANTAESSAAGRGILVALSARMIS